MNFAEPRDFGELLHQYRKACGLTQRGLAAQAGLSVRAISDLERGINRTPRKDTVERLVAALHLSPSERAAFEHSARASIVVRGTVAAGSVAEELSLPLPPTPLIGRQEETAQLGLLLRRAEVRLVTLTGPAGVGKTRLALQVAAEFHTSFAQGLAFVSLAPITAPDLVGSTIAQVLGLREMGGQPIVEHLKAALRGQERLLVLDNFEQVIAAAPLVAELLGVAPGLKVLITSREVLRLRGEYEYPVPPLPLPPRQQPLTLAELPQYAATALFLERARAVRPALVVTQAQAQVVADICWRLDGLPLALELAAARVKILPLSMLQTRLERRLPLLSGGARDLPARQQTLRNAIAWSHQLLTPAEQRLFRRLAVFQGGRTLEATEAVCNPDEDLNVLEGVQSLLDKSLLQQVVGREGVPRFWVLETIHEYAREKLEESGDAGRLAERHATYFLALAEQAAAALHGPDQGRWMGRLEEEHDNLRAALAWALEYNARLGVQLAVALAQFWKLRGYLSEGRKWLEAAQATFAAGRDGAWEYQALVLFHLGFIISRQGDYTTAATLVEESLARYREWDDQAGIASSLNALGLLAMSKGDYAQARTLYEEGLAQRRVLGAQTDIATSLNNLGAVAWRQGDYAAAQAWHEESLVLFRALGDQANIAMTLVNLGVVAVLVGKLETAQARFAESLVLAQTIGSLRERAWGLLGLVACAAQMGALTAAAHWLGLVTQDLVARGEVLEPDAQRLIDTAAATVHTNLGPSAYQEAYTAGKGLTWDAAIAEALAFCARLDPTPQDNL